MGVHVWGYRKAGRGEGKGLGSREAGFDAGKGRGSAGECCSGVSTVARMTWESMRPLGDSDGTVGDNGMDLPKMVRDLCRCSRSFSRIQSSLSLV